jgi:hypothetical protein
LSGAQALKSLRRRKSTGKMASQIGRMEIALRSFSPASTQIPPCYRRGIAWKKADSFVRFVLIHFLVDEIAFSGEG